MSLFKNAGWANRLACGVSRPAAGICSLILSIDLTLKGLDKTDEIMTNVYQYINMLRSDEPQKWIFDEEQALCQLNFRFKDKEPPYEYVTGLAGNLLAWRNSSSNPELRFPEPNSFIATEFDLVRNKCPTNVEMPELLVETEMSRIWYFQDTEFNLPKGFVTFHIVSPFAFFDPFHTSLGLIYANLFEDHINELTYSSMLAGMTVYVKHTVEGIKLSFLGYSHKLKSFVKEIVTKFVNYYQPVTDRFECIRENMSREFSNFSMKPAYQQSGAYLTSLISDHSWISDDFVRAFKGEYSSWTFCVFHVFR
ncbi:unnamed protein product [Schistosoma margrebowiei]|uniref:Peptidase M16 middle/third domain-containing protein n=1 Tax=Schistosoma margrebowiei TaxID=48269 RepID=A0A3P8FJY6_9TREM|nr:unnamed protein product [Schistosoma margrebowiei]